MGTDRVKEETEDLDDDDDNGAGEHVSSAASKLRRNKRKAIKFWELKDTFADHIKTAIEEAHLAPEGKRARITRMIEEAFTENDEGLLQLDLEKPYFRQIGSQSERKFSKDQWVSEPRLVYAERFREGEAGVKRAVAQGQVVEFYVGKVPYCAHRKIDAGCETQAITGVETFGQA